jgi:hypothetical protein
LENVGYYFFVERHVYNGAFPGDLDIFDSLKMSLENARIKYFSHKKNSAEFKAILHGRRQPRKKKWNSVDTLLLARSLKSGDI